MLVTYKVVFSNKVVYFPLTKVHDFPVLHLFLNAEKNVNVCGSVLTSLVGYFLVEHTISGT